MMARQDEYDLSFINSEFNWDRIITLKPKVLSKKFSRLVLQTPQGSQIVCVIDEICCYNGPGGDARWVINELVALTKRTELLCGPRRFKLLLTCEHETFEIKADFESDSLPLLKSDDQIMKVPQEAKNPLPCPEVPNELEPRGSS